MPFFPASSSSGSKRECKYGPRDADGKCPKKPKAAKKARAKRPCKYGPRDADGYCPKKPSSNPWKNAEEVLVTKVTGKSATARRAAKSPQERATEKAVTKVAEKAAEAGLAKLAKKVQDNPGWSSAAAGLAGTKVSQVGKLPGIVKVGALSGIVLAGIAAYAATTWIITRKAKTREEKLRQAAEAAEAYRESRKLAAVKKGAPLTQGELNTLAKEFKKKIASLGITSFSQKG